MMYVALNRRLAQFESSRRIRVMSLEEVNRY